MEIIGIVTYTDELTVNLAIESLRSQPVDFKEIVLLDNVIPMRTAFNKALDYCQNCDRAFLLAADTILDEDVLPKLLDAIDDNTFLVNAHSRDIFFGDVGSGGFFLWNMNIWRDEWRYSTGPIADIDLITRIESESDLERHKVYEVVSTHHPIWTPRELWGRVRFTLPKYIETPQWIEVYRDFFDRETARLPQNATLKIGHDLFKLMVENLGSWILNDKDPVFINNQFEEFAKWGGYNLDKFDFYAMEGWDEIAKKLLSKEIKPEGFDHAI